MTRLAHQSTPSVRMMAAAALFWQVIGNRDLRGLVLAAQTGTRYREWVDGVTAVCNGHLTLMKMKHYGIYNKAQNSRFMYSDAYEYIVENNRLDILQFLYEHEYLIDYGGLEWYATTRGNLDIIKWKNSKPTINNCVNRNLFELAALYDRVHIVKWIFKMGYRDIRNITKVLDAARQKSHTEMADTIQAYLNRIQQPQQ